jgi:serine/threonine-protein kinase TTK/MPS1
MEIFLEKDFHHLYSIQKIIGKGDSSTVYKVKDNSNGKIYALKTQTFSKKSLKGKYPAIRRDFDIVSGIRSKNIVHYRKIFVVDEGSHVMICILMDYVKGPTLYQIKQSMISLDEKPSQKEIKFILKNLVQIIKTLDSHDITHGDVKTENIIISGKNLVLVDFGIARKGKKRSSEDRRAVFSIVEEMVK